jgi:hypothetical protein
VEKLSRVGLVEILRVGRDFRLRAAVFTLGSLPAFQPDNNEFSSAVAAFEPKSHGNSLLSATVRDDVWWLYYVNMNKRVKTGIAALGGQNREIVV